MRRLEILGARLPYVNGSARKRGNDFETLLTQYLALPKEPLIVIVDTLTGVNTGVRGELHFDSMLGAAVVQSFPCPVDFSGGTKVVPLPLDTLWISEDGLPLFAASLFRQEGPWITDRQYWHKRYPLGHVEWSTRKNANTSAGRWKEYRVPLAPQVPDSERRARLETRCIGNKEEIERLVQYLTHIGKKASQGFGRVLKFEVTPWDVHPDVAKLIILNNRPVPAAYYYEQHGPDVPMDWIIQGWTPPYWYAPWHRACYRPPAQPDYYEAAL